MIGRIIPKENHSVREMTLPEEYRGSGVRTSDASLAMDAMENKATVYSNDTDFSRFEALNCFNR
ncbi:MAG: hypothetical protein AAF649_07890 [Verrucomicrobiota bacterium]